FYFRILSNFLGSLHVAGRFRLSKTLYNEKGRPPYLYQSAKSRDLCVAFCTSQGRGVPAGPVGRTAILSLPFSIGPAQRGSAVWERRHSASPLQKLEKVA
ncbi:hypothetical protein DW741_14295, partial [Ruminococcaceae bacterium AM28-23LB]